MNAWTATATDVLNLALGHPQGAIENVILIAGALIAATVIMKLAARAVGSPFEGWPLSILVVLLGLMILWASAAATSLYLVGLVSRPLFKTLLLIGVPVLAAALVAAPLQKIILRTRYLGTLMSFAASLVAAFAVILLCGAIIDSVRGGGDEAAAIRRRTEALDKIIGK